MLLYMFFFQFLQGPSQYSVFMTTTFVCSNENASKESSLCEHFHIQYVTKCANRSLCVIYTHEILSTAAAVTATTTLSLSLSLSLIHYSLTHCFRLTFSAYTLALSYSFCLYLYSLTECHT